MQTIIRQTLKDTMYSNKIPVFLYTIHYPSFQTTCSIDGAQKVNAYYTSAARKTEAYCRTVLYPMALESAQYIQTNQPPFHSYELTVDYQITYNRNCITSLIMNQYTFMGGAHGETLRTSATWDFHTGNQLPLERFYPRTSSFPKSLLNEIEGQIIGRLKATPSAYFPDYAALLQEHFQPENYYLRPGGIVIYYQQYDIAPYASGIPEYFFPFGNKYTS